MRKEVILAIIAGSILGLVIAFGIWRANSFLKPAENQTENTENNQESQLPAVDLAIAAPENQEVVTSSKVTIKGVTKPNSYVVIVGEEKDFQTVSDEKGAFEKEVTLLAGLNNLLVYSFDPEDGSTVKELVLVYSSEFAKFLEETESTSAPATASPSGSASPEANPIREKVLEKVATAGKKATAYIGTVTDFSSGTIQIRSSAIKDETGEIIQASFDSEATDFVKVTDTESKAIEEGDVAIGDFVVVMGFKNGNGVLSAKRVLVTQKPEVVNLAATLGVVQGVEKKNVTIKTNDNVLITAVFGKSWSGPELDEFSEGDKIIVAGVKKDETITARTLIIITTSSPTPSASPSPKPTDQASPEPTATP